jgi:hypothetical protein
MGTPYPHRLRIVIGLKPVAWLNFLPEPPRGTYILIGFALLWFLVVALFDLRRIIWGRTMGRSFCFC